MKTAPRVLICLYLALSFYALGGGAVEEFVYYPAWKLVGPEEFPAFHRSLSDRLIPSFVAPFFLSVLTNAVLAWRRPPELPRRLVLAALGLNLVIVGATVWLAIPIQMQLGEAQSLAEIDRLLSYDRPLRLVPGLLVGAVNWAMLDRLLRRQPALPARDVDPHVLHAEKVLQAQGTLRLRRR